MLGVITPPAHALTVDEAPLPVLAAEAELIAVGTVVRRTVEPAANGTSALQTRYRLRIEHVLDPTTGRPNPAKSGTSWGEAAAFLDVFLPGGQADGRTTWVPGIPQLATGDEALWLLERVRDRWVPLGYRLGVLPTWAAPALQTGEVPPLLTAFVHLSTITGEPARWNATCLRWYLSSTDESRDLTREVVTDALQRAFDVWNNVADAYPRWGFAGASCTGSVIGQEAVRSRNIVLFREEAGSWIHATRVVALTSTTIDDTSGFIVDADVEFNGEHQRFAVNGDPEAYDLQQIATHEIGHMLGLDHTPIETAVMYELSKKGERDNLALHPDDANGLAASHPLSLQPNDADCTFTSPVPLLAPLCPLEDEACAASGETAPPLSTVLFVLFALAWRARQRAARC